MLEFGTSKMAIADEKLCLQWNDFKENVSSAFGDLRRDKEFTDVTLVCEDGQQVEAHKLFLIASSPFFQNIPTSLDLHERRQVCEYLCHGGLPLFWRGKRAPRKSRYISPIG